jgi:hypothetical protein
VPPPCRLRPYPAAVLLYLSSLPIDRKRKQLASQYLPLHLPTSVPKSPSHPRPLYLLIRREMNGIPVVDFGAFLQGGADDKRRVAQDIDDAFCKVGFVYLKNHGVGKEVVDECFAWSKKFFDLPLETKMLAPHPPGGGHHRGYSAPGVEKVSQGVYDVNELNKLREVSAVFISVFMFIFRDMC